MSLVELMIQAIVSPINLIGEALATTITMAVVGALESIASIIPGSKD